MTDVNHKDTEAQRTHEEILEQKPKKDLRAFSVFFVAPWLTAVIKRLA